MQEKQLEREAIAEMKEHGGDLLVSYVGTPPTKSSLVVSLEQWLGEEFFTNLTKLSLDGPMTDGGFEQVANCRHLKEVWVNNAKLTANGLLPLKDLHDLKLIDLDILSETDTDLGFLDGMPQLDYVGLSKFHPTDAGWQRIKSLHKLRRLSLRSQRIKKDMPKLKDLSQLDELELIYCSDIEDADLVNLEGLTQLKSLRLDGAQMTDAGLQHLEGLTRLENLVLYTTYVTPDGVMQFLEAVPNCQISR